MSQVFDTEGVRNYFKEQSRQYWLKEGRRDVVEWIKKCQKDSYSENLFLINIMIPINNWEAQLKEWGIK